MSQAWRIVHAKFLAQAFDGEGARIHGGRWNSPGTRAVYCAGSVSLATLEMLVHLPGSALLPSYRLIEIEIPDSKIELLDVSLLPRDWTRSPAPPRLQDLGDEWISSRRSVALRVPSAVVPMESNFLLNPNHPDFHKLAIGTPRHYPLDPRLI